MKTKQEIFERVANTISDLFEIDKETIHLESNLYDDLDIDSIDAVDLVVELRSFIGKKIGPEDFKQVRSVEDVVAAVYQLINE